jgi:hypothetical protein
MSKSTQWWSGLLLGVAFDLWCKAMWLPVVFLLPQRKGLYLFYALVAGALLLLVLMLVLTFFSRTSAFSYGLVWPLFLCYAFGFLVFQSTISGYQMPLTWRLFWFLFWGRVLLIFGWVTSRSLREESSSR